MIRTKGQVLEEIRNSPEMWKTFCGWEEKYQQEYLDIFSDIIQNENRKIKNRLEEWLVFLSQDDPEMIIKLLKKSIHSVLIWKE